MAAPRKYPDELRERATRLAIETRKDPAGRAGSIKRIADQLDVHPEALRGWVKRAETDEGIVPGTTSTDAARIAELEREVKELRTSHHMPLPDEDYPSNDHDLRAPRQTVVARTDLEQVAVPVERLETNGADQHPVDDTLLRIKALLP